MQQRGHKIYNNAERSNGNSSVFHDEHFILLPDINCSLRSKMMPSIFCVLGWFYILASIQWAITFQKLFRHVIQYFCFAVDVYISNSPDVRTVWELFFLFPFITRFSFYLFGGRVSIINFACGILPFFLLAI